MQSKRTTSPAAAMLASFIFPGVGYFLVGQKWRALITGGGVIALFALGILFAGVRVVSLPGYQNGSPKYIEVYRGGMQRMTTNPATEIKPTGKRDMHGRPLYDVTRHTPTGVTTEPNVADPPIGKQLVLLVSPFSAIFDNLWFLGQVLMGPIIVVAGYLSNSAAQAGIDRTYGRLWDVGSLYTAVAGMLNLLLILDASARAREKAGAK